MMVYWRKMCSVKTLKQFLLIALLPFTMQLQANESDGCNFSVMYLKATLDYSIGDTMTLNCTVQFCEKPLFAGWCKQRGNSCEPLLKEDKTFKDHPFKTFIVYTVPSVNLTDSGKYQCQAKQNNEMSKGHIITVHVHGVKVTTHEPSTTGEFIPTNSTMMIQGPVNSISWVSYIIIAVGTVSAVGIIVLITYFCIRNFHEPLETAEPSANSQRTQYHNMTEINEKPTIYENMNEFSEGISSSSRNSLTVNESFPRQSQKREKPSCTDQQDTIIYASLSESVLSRKSSLKLTNNEDTEYAAINIKH
ncbi:B- and T-lymphocyte attenuator-like isoform X2 [Hemitrygon akajei]|uniref:B- and T-lymphocyte attenuator-like isoform X2 n=1 Tax=Hemitrygon akajei TaxID=2704970 RepID=UPI003BF94AA6